MSARRIVLVSGAPGAGKTSLAIPLAHALGFALITKDIVKETLYDTIGPRPNDIAFSRQIGGAAMETLWALAAKQTSAVLEANFRPYSEYERNKINALDAQIVEVNCVCPPQEAARRFAERARRPTHHPAHFATEITPEQLAEFDRPIGSGTLISVDTTQPVDIAALAEQVRAAFASS